MRKPNYDFMYYFKYSPSLRKFMTEHPKEMSLYLWLLSFQYDHGEPVPENMAGLLAAELEEGHLVSIVTQEDLVTYTGLSIATIKRQYKFLVEAGLIKVRNTGIIRLGRRIDEGNLRGDVYGWGIFAREYDFNIAEELRRRKEKGMEYVLPPNEQKSINEIPSGTYTELETPPAYKEDYNEKKTPVRRQDIAPHKWDVRAFIAHFCALYKEKHGESYPMSGKEAGLMATIVKTYSGKAKLKRLMEVYVENYSLYNNCTDYYRGQGITVGGFNSALKRMWTAPADSPTPGIVTKSQTKAEEKSALLEEARMDFDPRQKEVLGAEKKLLDTYAKYMSLDEINELQSNVGMTWLKGADVALDYLRQETEKYKARAKKGRSDAA